METEIKVRVEPDGLDSLRIRVQELGARQCSQGLAEENVLFDFPDQRLKLQGCALRVRQYGSNALLTFKGRDLQHPYLKQREEIETEVADRDSMVGILEALGLVASFRYSKVREIFELEIEGRRATISLDTTSLGAFVEIEAEPQDVDFLAGKLGWDRSRYITQSYVDLLQESRQGQN